MASDYFNYVTLNTGHMRQSARTEVTDEALIARIALTLAEAIARKRERVPLPHRPDHTLRVTAVRTVMIVSIFAPPVGENRGRPLISLGVAPVGSGADGRMVWEHMIKSPAPGPKFVSRPDQCPSEPWVAARIVDPLGVAAAWAWLTELERCISWAWIESVTSSKHAAGDSPATLPRPGHIDRS